MIYDQPDLREIDRMIKFCLSHERLYIYGCEENQILLAKYLQGAQIKLSGFLVSVREHFESEKNGLPIYTPDELDCGPGSGILLALPGGYYNDVLVNLQARGFSDIFFMSEHNKRTIAYKLRPRKRSNFWLEVNVADHCNLNCQMCDHFSQLAGENFLEKDDYERDMGRLAKLSENRLDILKLQGGEPLLHRGIRDFFQITRRYFPDTRILLYTNGIKLLDDGYYPYHLWEEMKKYEVEIQLTQYPLKLDYEAIDSRAEDYGIRYARFVNAADRSDETVKVSVKHPFDLSGSQDLYGYIGCYQLNESITLRRGRIFTCPVIAYVEYFNRHFGKDLKVSEEDSIDIYQARSFEQIAEFVAKRTEFCRYCDIRRRAGGQEWKVSRRSVEEYL